MLMRCGWIEHGHVPRGILLLQRIRLSHLNFMKTTDTSTLVLWGYRRIYDDGLCL